MKLIVEVSEYRFGESHIYAYLKTERDEDEVYNPLRQAEIAFRLGELTAEIEKTVKAYYSKERGLTPTESQSVAPEPVYDELGNPIPPDFLKEKCKQ